MSSKAKLIDDVTYYHASLVWLMHDSKYHNLVSFDGDETRWIQHKLEKMTNPLLRDLKAQLRDTYQGTRNNPQMITRLRLSKEAQKLYGIERLEDPKPKKY